MNNIIQHKFKIIFGLFLIVVFGIVLTSFAKNKNPRVLGAQTPVKKPVIIIDNGIEFQFMSAESELTDVFADIGIQVYPEDKVSVLVDPGLGIGTRVRIRRATAVIVNDGGKIKTFRTWKETVKQLLDEQDIELSDLDRVSPSLDTTLTSDIKITIVRVRTEEKTEILPVPYKIVYKDDPNIYIGRSYVSQSGKNGEKEVLFKLTYENEQLASKESVSETVLAKPQNKIICKGTKPYSVQEGLASWHPGATASRRYSRGTKLKVTNLANGKSVVTTVGGWGPEAWTGRVIDLNFDVFQAIANPWAGIIRVRIEEIR